MGWLAGLSKHVQRAFAAAEDPRRTAPQPSERQAETLRRVHTAVEELDAARARLQAQRAALQDQLDTSAGQARDAIRGGRHDGARLLLQRRAAAATELLHLDRQIAGLIQEGERLALEEQRLAGQIVAHEVRQQSARARYHAAEAQLRAGGVLAGLTGEIASTGSELAEVNERVEYLEAHATALQEIFGVVAPAAAPGISDEQVNAELAALQAEAENHVQNAAT